MLALRAKSPQWNNAIYPYHGPGFGYYFLPWHNGSDSAWWGVGKGAGWVLAAVGSCGLAIKAGLALAATDAVVEGAEVVEAEVAEAEVAEAEVAEELGPAAGDILQFPKSPIPQPSLGEVDGYMSELGAEPDVGVFEPNPWGVEPPTPEPPGPWGNVIWPD
jgi:hypothetical protein